MLLVRVSEYLPGLEAVYVVEGAAEHSHGTVIASTKRTFADDVLCIYCLELRWRQTSWTIYPNRLFEI